MVRRSPFPDFPPSGRAAGVCHPHAVSAGVWVWGPNTVPLACMCCGPVPTHYWSYTPYSGAILVGERYCYWLKPPRRNTTPTHTLYWVVLKIKSWVLMTLLCRRQENTVLLSNCGLTGTSQHVSLLGLGGEGRTGGVHSADVHGVKLPSPLLAEAQSIDSVIRTVYFSTAQGTAPVHPDPPVCTTEANGLGSRRRDRDTLHVLYAS